MSNEGQAVQFMYGTQVEYDYSSKRSDAVYIAEDTRRVFVGDKEFSRPVFFGDDYPTYGCTPGSFFVQNTPKTVNDVVVESKSLWYNETGNGEDWVRVASSSDVETIDGEIHIISDGKGNVKITTKRFEEINKVTLDDLSTVTFKMGYDEGGLYVVTD